MNVLDYSILALLIWGFISGFRRGLVMELCNIGGIFLGIWLALHSSDAMAGWLKKETEISSDWIPHTAFLLVFVLTYVGAFLAGKALSGSLKLMMLGFFNKLAGGIFGMAKMLLFSSVIFLLLRSYGFPALSKELQNSSQLHGSITAIAEYFYPRLREV